MFEGREDWLAQCLAWSVERGVSRELFQVLRAFGHDREESVLFAEADRLLPTLGVVPSVLAAEQGADGLPEVDGKWSAEVFQGWIEEALSGEVDGPQAAMFGRRFASVWKALCQQGETSPESVLLAVGLVHRLRDIARGPAPRALRVRALSDFYYSYAARLYHASHLSPEARASLPTPGECANRLTWRVVSPGIKAARLEALTTEGPVHINLLRTSGVRLEMHDCRAFHEQCPSFATFVKEQGAVAGVSGGFFLYSEPEILLPSRRTDPVGLLVSGGEVLSPPVFARASLLQLASGRCVMGPVSSSGTQILWEGGRCVIGGAVTPAMMGRQPVVFHRAWGARLMAHAHRSFVVVGREVAEVGVGLRSVPLAGWLVVLPEKWKGRLPKAGEEVSYRLPTVEQEQVMSAMSGGPMLLENGHCLLDLVREDFYGEAPPVTFSQDETFDQNLLPRMAVGQTSSDELIFAAVDGRHFERAPGLTLRQTADLLRALGCVRAMNLDGGSSKRMVVDGEMVDLSTTEVVVGTQKRARVRPVHSAILLFDGD